MATRGRKSAASLEVVPFPGRQRPKPPSELEKPEAAEWRSVVDRMPADWFGTETHGLLIAYCRHRVTFGFLSKRITLLQQGPVTDDDVGLYDKLLAMREREGRAMSSLATRMRLTQQTRIGARPADTASRQRGNGEDPWNFGKAADERLEL